MGGAQVHTGLQLPDGGWILYFEAVTEKDEEEDVYVWEIGRATAPAPEGPWTLDPGPVFTRGEPGSWDEGSVMQPSVLVVDGHYVMYYAGFGKQGNGIGRATSSDGVVWTRDPEPLLTPSESWEREHLTRPDVVRTGDGFVMLYGNRSGSNRGVATSRDGVAWTKFAGNPVITVNDVPRSTIRTGELVYTGDIYLVYLENGGQRTGSDISILTRDLPIEIR